MSTAELSRAGLEASLRFPVFGTHAHVLIGPPFGRDSFSAEMAALSTRTLLEAIHQDLTRFEPGSELSRLNDSPEELVRVSGLLRTAIEAGLAGAEASGGLVDPTLLPALEEAGYAHSRAGLSPASLSEALAAAPARAPASPQLERRWSEIEIDARRSLVRRRRRLRLDLGGTAKGLAVDLASERLQAFASFAVDAGGDIRIGGRSTSARPVLVRNPLRGGVAHVFELECGAAATSGLETRIWRTAAGYAHHLLDPSSGRPAWTGVIQATALAPTAFEAEVLAKTALLSGPAAGAEVLRPQGGALVLDSGQAEVLEPPL